MLDVSGKIVGQVDWIWPDGEKDQGEFIGVGLRWLRGTALPIPAQDVQIDQAARTLRVAFSENQIKKARRLSISRSLTARERRAIYSRYRTPRPLVPRQTFFDTLAA